MIQIDKLNAVLAYIKQSFIGKDEIADLLGISLVARENLFLLGPPGTAKSAIIRSLSECLEGGNNFEYLLTRFTEPNELFGPFDIRRLKEGELVTNTEGMLPEASLVFLDEIFNANSAILNSLLLALNEKVFRRGRENRKLPVLMFAGASNQLPEEEALSALLDRFLLRVKCGYVQPDHLHEVLLAGWKMEGGITAEKPLITPAEVAELQAAARKTDLTLIRKRYVDVIHSLRNAGIKVSDRRAVKLQNLIAASALLCNRQQAQLSDLWVLKYIWDTEEQMEVLSGIVNNVIEQEVTERAHPQAFFNKVPRADDVMKEIQLLAQQWNTPEVSFEEQNVIKDKLRYVQTRCDWIKNTEQKQFVQKEIEALWQKMLQTI